jgi:hypothetical protein
MAARQIKRIQHPARCHLGEIPVATSFSWEGGILPVALLIKGEKPLIL